MDPSHRRKPNAPARLRVSLAILKKLFNNIGAMRTFAEELCQLSANGQHHSISLLGPKRSDLARTV